MIVACVVAGFRNSLKLIITKYGFIFEFSSFASIYLLYDTIQILTNMFLKYYRAQKRCYNCFNSPKRQIIVTNYELLSTIKTFIAELNLIVVGFE